MKITTKKCSNCKETKSISLFYKNNKKKGRLYSFCKKCWLEKSKKWAKENKGKVRDIQKKCYQKNKEKRKEYYLKNKENIKERVKKYENYSERKAYQKEYQRRYRETNKEKRKIICRKWRANNRILRLEQYKNNPRIRIDNSMKSLVYLALKKKKAGQRWEKLVGYTLKELVLHLEKQFDEKMNWDNYGSYWWIDHIKARSLFKYKTAKSQEFKKCWALENLQPMEKMENIKKSNHKQPKKLSTEKA
jgi:hypothetical protein